MRTSLEGPIIKNTKKKMYNNLYVFNSEFDEESKKIGFFLQNFNLVLLLADFEYLRF